MAVSKATPAFKRSRGHIIYKLQDGTRVPGVTTISGLIDKSPFLVPWANNLGLNGVNSRSYTDPLKGVGTLTHARILQDLVGGELSENIDEYSKKEIDMSDNSMLSWWKFREKHDFGRLLDCETPRVSEKYRYGGTPDVPGWIDDIPSLLDLKTGSGIYMDHVVQSAGYCQLIKEIDGVKIERILLLNIPRTPDEKYYLREFGRDAINLAWRYFLNLRKQYDIKRVFEAEFKQEVRA